MTTTAATTKLKDHLATQTTDGDAVAPAAWLDKLKSLVDGAKDDDVVAALKDSAGLVNLLGRCVGSTDDAVVRRALRAVRVLCRVTEVRSTFHGSDVLVSNAVKATTRAQNQTEAFNTLAVLAKSHANDLFTKTDLVARAVDALDLGQVYDVRSSAMKLVLDFANNLAPENETAFLRTPRLLERIALNLDKCTEEEKQGHPKDMVSPALRALTSPCLDANIAKLVLATQRGLVNTVIRVARESVVEGNVVDAFELLHCLAWAPSNARELVAHVPGIIEFVKQSAGKGTRPAVRKAALVVLGCLLEVAGNATQALLGIVVESARSDEEPVVRGAARALRVASAGPRGRELLDKPDVLPVLWALSWADEATVRADASVTLASIVDPSDSGRRHLIRDDPSAMKRLVDILDMLKCFKRVGPTGVLRALRSACVVKKNRDALASPSTIAKLAVVLSEVTKRDDADAARLACETLLEFCADADRVAAVLRPHQPLRDAVAVVVDKASVESWRAAAGKARELKEKLQPPAPAPAPARAPA